MNTACVIALLISIHALREEGDPFPCVCVSTPINFNPRPPRGGRLVSATSGEQTRSISIHALREEGDALFLLVKEVNPYFNPRPPRGGRPLDYVTKL